MHAAPCPFPSDTPVTLVIIGTGFGGLGMAIRLKQAGIDDFLVLEKADAVGGCWRENHYPGAACDVPSHLYSYSFEPRFDWSRKFAPQAEIRDYLEHCAEKYGVYPHIRFNTRMTGARFDEAEGQWQIQTDQGPLQARFLITACGQLSEPAWPALPGREQFKGALFHSAHWDHGVDLQGRRVAVIGTGASAIQFVPQIVPQVASLRLFQRSAPYVIPKPDRAYSPLEQALLSRLPALHQLSRGMIYLQHEARALGFNLLKPLMQLYKVRWQQYLNRCVKDPALRTKLTPDYPLGCKRILISNDYYPALTQSHVEVVTEAIARITADGILTADGQHHAVDVIILGTGFRATEFLTPLHIEGLGGRDLNQVWRDGAEAYLGITVHGFPNLFMLYGPNTNLGHNSIVYMLESQITYILQALTHARRDPSKPLNVKDGVQDRFNRKVQAQIRNTVWDQGCTSWYKTASGKNTNNWPGFTFTYRHQTAHFQPTDYQ